MELTETSFSRVLNVCRLVDSKLEKRIIGSTWTITILIKGVLQEKDGCVVSDKLIDAIVHEYNMCCLVNKTYVQRDGNQVCISIPIGDRGSRDYSFPHKEVKLFDNEATMENVALAVGQDIWVKAVDEKRQIMLVSISIIDASGRDVKRDIDSTKATEKK